MDSTLKSLTIHYSESSEADYTFIPIFIAVLSAGILVAQTASTYAFKSRGAEDLHHGDASEGIEGSPESIVTRNGGVTVFSFMMARVLGCAALVAFWLLPLTILMPKTRPGGTPSDKLVHEFVLAANVSVLHILQDSERH